MYSNLLYIILKVLQEFLFTIKHTPMVMNGFKQVLVLEPVIFDSISNHGAVVDREY